MAYKITGNIYTAKKKESRCDFCGQKIKIGERYESSMVTDGSEVWFHKAHVMCCDIAQEMYDYFEMSGCDGGFTEDEFIEGLNEVCRNFQVQPHPTAIPDLKSAVQYIFKLKEE